MSATGSGTEAPAGARQGTSPDVPEDSAHAYFQAIERIFLRLRGGPLLLSPLDWQVTRRWYEAGVPVDLVSEVLAQVFARRAERGATDRVSSLRYCAPAVEAAWVERQMLLAAGLRAGNPPAGEGEQALPAARGATGDPAEVGQSIATRLGVLADRLPEQLPEVAVWRARIVGLRGEAPVVEDQLRILDGALVDAARCLLSAAEQSEIAAEVGRLSAGLRQRLPAAEVGRARERLERQMVRRQLQLPLLSLF